MEAALYLGPSVVMGVAEVAVVVKIPQKMVGRVVVPDRGSRVRSQVVHQSKRQAVSEIKVATT
jgi:hypothetical protein